MRGASGMQTAHGALTPRAALLLSIVAPLLLLRFTPSHGNPGTGVVRGGTKSVRALAQSVRGAGRV